MEGGVWEVEGEVWGGEGLSGRRGECGKWWGLETRKHVITRSLFKESQHQNFWLFHKLCLDLYRVEEMRREEEMKTRFITDYGKPRRFSDVLPEGVL